MIDTNTLFHLIRLHIKPLVISIDRHPELFLYLSLHVVAHMLLHEDGWC